MSKKHIAFGAVVSLIILSPISYDDFLNETLAEEDFTEISSDTEWSSDEALSGYILIDPGATLTIKKGVKLSFEDGAILEVQGKLITAGTVKEPVVFKKAHPENLTEFYSIQSEGVGEIEIRNADISGGGNYFDAVPVSRSRGILNKVLALTIYAGVINVLDNSKVTIESTRFHDNNLALHVDRFAESPSVLVHRSWFVNNGLDVVNQGGSSTDAKYNWWGDATGPSSEKIKGDVSTSEFATLESFHDPVIIIPGILGSSQEEDIWKLDPVLHTYDDLYDSLDQNGYTLGIDLFDFAYDWQKSNVDTALLLKQKIADIKQARHWPKVDLIAHSMGGLVGRQYVESPGYQDDVDQLITLGTPQLGAPESYAEWEGATFPGFKGSLIKWMVKQMAKHQGYSDVFDFLHGKPIKSLEELLPMYDYLYRKDHDNALSKYPDNYPTNIFLENLNNPTKDLTLKKVEFTRIIGSLASNSSTIAGFDVVSRDKGKYWVDGYPDDIEGLTSEDGILRDLGDGTVPLYSAEATQIPSDYTITLQGSDHNSLPGDAEVEIFKTLGIQPPFNEVHTGAIKKILVILLYSPIDVQVVSPSGKKVGKDFANGHVLDQIPGAFYSGYQTENEIITIPNPEDGDYQVLTQGTGNGGYAIDVANISEGNVPNESTESLVTLEGRAIPGNIDKADVTLMGDTVTLPSVADTVPPVVSIVSPEDKAYLNSEQLDLSYIATDDVSAADKLTNVAKLDGVITTKAILDLSLSPLGQHTYAVISADEAGNSAMQSVNFRVETSYSALMKNLDHYYQLGLFTRLQDMRQVQAGVTGLELIRKAIDLVKATSLPAKTKANLIQGLEFQLQQGKTLLIKYLNSLGSRLDTNARARIIESIDLLY